MYLKTLHSPQSGGAFQKPAGFRMSSYTDPMCSAFRAREVVMAESSTSSNVDTWFEAVQGGQGCSRKRVVVRFFLLLLLLQMSM